MRIKDKLRSIDVRPSKGRGQNFLIDSSVIDAIVAAGAISPGEKIVEIGPGLGALTAEIRKYGNVTTIEVEEKFCEVLREQFPDINVLHSDVRAVDFKSLGDKLLVFGNLPYIFSTDIIFHLILYRTVVNRAVLLLQKEFAERLASPPGSKVYGSLSVACQLWADVILGPKVKGASFHPPTQVESRIVTLKFLDGPRFPIEDPLWFEKVVRASFSQRRRMVHNSLLSGGFLRENVEEALESCGINGTRRAETLSIEEFVKLSSALYIATRQGGSPLQI